MKILIVSTYDNLGGAARGAYSIHKGLLRKGFDSTMLVRKKVSKDSKVISLENKFTVFKYKLINKLETNWYSKYKNRSKTKFSTTLYASSNIVKKINALKPDIVHMQWVADGLITYNDFIKIKAPIVWTLRDMMPFTGGCHYTEGCTKFETICGSCPVLKSRSQKDLSYKVFKSKYKALETISNQKMSFTGISKWLTNKGEKSILLKKYEGYYIPNIIDSDLYFPKDKKASRKKLNLPLDKKLILFGAIGAKTDPRKGYEYLVKTIEKIDSGDIAVVTFGGKTKETQTVDKTLVYNFGFINYDQQLIDLYSAADVMVVPSLQEAFGKTVGEAMSCGTPVVAFDVGGPKDIIDHKVNGYLAELCDVEDLKNGIQWILNHKNLESLSEEARKKIVKKFNADSVIEQYINVYKKMLNQTKLIN